MFRVYGLRPMLSTMNKWGSEMGLGLMFLAYTGIVWIISALTGLGSVGGDGYFAGLIIMCTLWLAGKIDKTTR